MEVEVRIWGSKHKSGPPLFIKGKNFAPLIRAGHILDDKKTDQLIAKHFKELAEIWRRLP